MFPISSDNNHFKILKRPFFHKYVILLKQTIANIKLYILFSTNKPQLKTIFENFKKAYREYLKINSRIFTKNFKLRPLLYEIRHLLRYFYIEIRKLTRNRFHYRYFQWHTLTDTSPH